ncbi:MAG: antibiotic biosynthesis monooxygenase [Burkholderiales bacterium]|nr:MAG: antibiotic biosynthesis monooxygenase [Burkholderiales bacterium]
MIVTVFRTRLRPEASDEYTAWATRMAAIAETMPGYVSRKSFVAEDGERVTIVEFESEEAQRAWATHPEHLQAKKKARSDFYSEYRLQVCSVNRETRFPG